MKSIGLSRNSSALVFFTIQPLVSLIISSYIHIHTYIHGGIVHMFSMRL